MAAKATLEIEEMAEYFGGAHDLELGRKLLAEAREIMGAHRAP